MQNLEYTPRRRGRDLGTEALALRPPLALTPFPFGSAMSVGALASFRDAADSHYFIIHPIRPD
jgi:hypothetical protein